MKAKKFFAWLFGLLGVVLMAGTFFLCLTSLDAAPKLVQIPVEARQCSENLMEAICNGDYAAAEALLVGNPDLGLSEKPEGEVEAILWKAFEESLSYEFDGDCYATENGLARNVKVSGLHLVSAAALLKDKAAAILDPAMLDVNGAYPEEYRQQVLREAAETVVREDSALVTKAVVLQLTFVDGQWQVAPDKTLLAAISGGLA